MMKSGARRIFSSHLAHDRVFLGHLRGFEVVETIVAPWSDPGASGNRGFDGDPLDRDPGTERVD
jgi:hypothetical protein